jgi:hypothetical protein
LTLYGAAKVACGLTRRRGNAGELISSGIGGGSLVAPRDRRQDFIIGNVE